MFDKERFIEDCMQALSGGQRAVRDVVKRAVSQPSGIINTLGEPVHAGITPLYRSSDLTILNFAWAPCMNLMPHNHNMFAVIGIYTGREDNIIWRKTPDRIEATSAQSLGVGDVATLGRSENITRTAELEVAHSDTEAGTQLIVLANGGEAAMGGAD